MQIILNLSVEEFLMLSPADFDAKIAAILSDIAAVKTSVDALIAGALIPDSVGVALDSVQAAISELETTLTPVPPVA